MLGDGSMLSYVGKITRVCYAKEEGKEREGGTERWGKGREGRMGRSSHWTWLMREAYPIWDYHRALVSLWEGTWARRVFFSSVGRQGGRSALYHQLLWWEKFSFIFRTNPLQTKALIHVGPCLLSLNQKPRIFNTSYMTWFQFNVLLVRHKLFAVTNNETWVRKWILSSRFQ